MSLFNRFRLFIVLVLLAAVLFPCMVFAQPQGFASLGNTTTGSATGTSQGAGQRRVVYDTINSTFWAFYSDGSSIKYSRSISANTWASVGTISQNSSDFSVVFKDIGGVGNIFVAMSVLKVVNVYHFTTSSLSLTQVGSAVAALSPTGSTDAYNYPALTLNSANRLFVGAVYTDTSSGLYEARVAPTSGVVTDSMPAFSSAQTLGGFIRVYGMALEPAPSGGVIYAFITTPTVGLTAFKYNGSWSSLDTTTSEEWISSLGTGLNGTVRAIAAGSNKIYVGGDFTDAGGIAAADYLAAWDGSSWSAIAGLNGAVRAIAVNSSTGDVYVGGDFTSAGGVANTAHIAMWNGTNWLGLGSGLSSGGSTVNALLYHSSSSRLYVGGSFTDAGSASGATNVAYWDGNTWGAMATAPNGAVNAIANSGTKFYVGGAFTQAGGLAGTNHIAYWDTSLNSGTGGWVALAADLSDEVYALAVGSGTLYAGGKFLNAGGDSSADYLAGYSSNWAAVGGATVSGYVRALVSTGRDLYAGGDFSIVGDVDAAAHIARYSTFLDEWYAAQSGTNGNVYAIGALVPKVYFGGVFTSASDISATTRIAAYNELPVLGPIGGGMQPGISAVTDSAGNIHVVYTNKNGELVYKYCSYSAPATLTWHSSLRLASVEGVSMQKSAPSVSLRQQTNSVIAGWKDPYGVYYRRGNYPYGSSDWYDRMTISTGTTLYGFGMLRTDPIACVVTSGTSSLVAYAKRLKNANELSGRITAQSTPVPDISVYIMGAASGTATTDSEGDFYFHNVTNGSYSLYPLAGELVFDPYLREVTINDDDATALDFAVITPSPTPTEEPVPTDEPTPTETPTVTPTSDGTPVETATPTAVATSTFTPIGEASPSPTSIAGGPTATPTPTVAGPLPTATSTPVVQPTAVATATPTTDWSKAPAVKVVNVSGTAGKTVVFNYTVKDKNNKSKETIEISNADTVIKTVKTSMSSIPKNGKKKANVPTKGLKKGKYPYCIKSTNSKGFTSKPACAKLTLR